MERITHAAILRKDKCIVFGRDHARCILRSPVEESPGTQGFLTSKLRFVDRYTAAAIAFQAGQIDKWELGQGIVSEELWDIKSGGKHNYDEIVGYVLKEEVDMDTTGKEIIENLDDLIVLKDEARAAAKEKIRKMYKQLQDKLKDRDEQIKKFRSAVQPILEGSVKMPAFEIPDTKFWGDLHLDKPELAYHYGWESAMFECGEIIAKVLGGE